MAHLGNTIVNGALRVLGQATEDALQVNTINGVTVGNSPKFTDTNNAVTQTATTTDANYEVLFSATADNTTRTEGARKTTSLRFNPNKGALMEGYDTVATGNYSHAEGNRTTASGNYSHAEGINSYAKSEDAHAEGQATSAVYLYAHAEGSHTCAANDSAHAEGSATTASGSYSHTEGRLTYTTVSAISAHAEGHRTIASGKGAHAEGGYTTAETGGTKASGENSHAEGFLTTASASYSHAEGQSTNAAKRCAHAEGYGTTASGQSSHAEGYNTLVVAELYDSMYGSHAEGYQTTCGRDGSGKHAEGFKTSAYGTGAHSEGVSTIANGGDGAHAEGYYTTASGSHSHASGASTCAAGNNQTVIGRYNVADTTSLFIIGNGNSSTRSNALSVASDGTLSLTGQLKTSFKSAVATGSYAPTANTVPNLCTELRYSSGAMGSVSINTEYTKDGVTIPTGWYNFMWIPHRSGGNSGAASGDNCDYGVLYLTAMTMSSSFYLIRFSSGSITEVKNVLANDEYVINGGIFYDPQLSKFTKTTGDGWDKQVYSRKGYKNNVYVRFKAGQTNKAIMVGLNSDPTTDANYASIDFCWYLQNNGTLAIYESGTGYTTINSGTNVTYVAGEEFYIEVHDNKVYYYRNNDYYSEPILERVSTNKTTSSSSNFNKLYFDSSFHDQSGFIYDVKFGVTTQTASRILVNNEAGQGLLNHFPIAVSRNIVSSTSGMQQTTLQTFPYFSYCPPYHSLSVGEGASASKFEAFALGYNVEANANSSFAIGEGTIANGECQTVIGKYNGADSGAAFIIGCGTSNSDRRECFKIDFEGTVTSTKLIKANVFDFYLDHNTSNKWYRVLSRPTAAENGSASWKGIITVSVPAYHYTNGATKSFIVYSSFQSISFAPFDACDDVVGWIQYWRVSRDASNQYVEFQAGAVDSPASNPFRITFLNLTNNNAGECLTFYNTLIESTATSVDGTVIINQNFKLATA